MCADGRSAAPADAGRAIEAQSTRRHAARCVQRLWGDIRQQDAGEVPMSVVPERRPAQRAAFVRALAIALAMFAGAVAQAQAAPFGMSHPSSGGSMFQSGLLGWIFAQQAAFYRGLSGMIRASKDD